LAWWIWLLIAVGGLIFIIILICICKKCKKNDEYAEGRAMYEEARLMGSENNIGINTV
jgi:hypothetical protein